MDERRQKQRLPLPCEEVACRQEKRLLDGAALVEEPRDRERDEREVDELNRRELHHHSSALRTWAPVDLVSLGTNASPQQNACPRRRLCWTAPAAPDTGNRRPRHKSRK